MAYFAQWWSTFKSTYTNCSTPVDASDDVCTTMSSMAIGDEKRGEWSSMEWVGDERPARIATYKRDTSRDS